MLLDAGDPFDPRIHGQDVFFENQLLDGMGHPGAAQVVHVSLGPVGLSVVSKAVAKHEHAELLLGSRQGLGGVGPGAAQIADGFVTSLGNVDGGEFAGPMKPGQFPGVALVGFDPFTGLFGNLSGPHDDAMIAELKETPGQDETGGTGLVDDGDLIFGHAELFPDLEQASFGGKVRPAPLAIVLGSGAVVQGGGDNDGVFVDVEPDMEFDFHGVF